MAEVVAPGGVVAEVGTACVLDEVGEVANVAEVGVTDPPGVGVVEVAEVGVADPPEVGVVEVEVGLKVILIVPLSVTQHLRKNVVRLELQSVRETVVHVDL